MDTTSLRLLVQDALHKHMFGTASFIAEQITRASDATIGDLLIFAKCFYLQHQPRRCLAALEQRGLLSAQNTQLLSEALVNGIGSSGGNYDIHNASIHAPGISSSSSSSSSPPLDMSNLLDLIAAFQLASQCLFSLEQYDDCVALLEPFVFLDLELDQGGLTLNNNQEGISETLDPANNSLFVSPFSAMMTKSKALFSLSHPHQQSSTTSSSSSSSSSSNSNDHMKINPLSGIYCILGQCYDMLDNRPRAIRALVAAITIDCACTEASEYLLVHGLLSVPDKLVLYRDYVDVSSSSGRGWLGSYYRHVLLGDSGYMGEALVTSTADGSSHGRASSSSGGTMNGMDMHGVVGGGEGSHPLGSPSPSPVFCAWEPSTAAWMARKAEYLYENMRPEEAYHLARQAYTSDPFDHRGLLIYIACLVDLAMKTELFYLGHELSSTYPKLASSWYAVGCYYLACKKYEAAQKYLQIATKMDKRFAKAWVALGLSLSSQEESEHAIAAFRAACRLLPGDSQPMILMAKELVRTNYLSLALHLLGGALSLRPNDVVALNEIGVIYLRMPNRLDEAVSHLAKAVSVLEGDVTNAVQEDGLGQRQELGQSDSDLPSTGSLPRHREEILGNYATALRKSGRLTEALDCYQRCLVINPRDAAVHAGIGYTLHLQRKFDRAISAYHRALALQPTFTFCSEMLGRAMIDATEGTDADRDQAVNNNNNNDNDNALFGENCSPNRLGGYGDGGGGDTDMYGDWSEGWSGLPSDRDFFKNLKYSTEEQPWLYSGDDGSRGGVDAGDDGLGSGLQASASSSSAINFLAGLRDDVLPPPPPSSNTNSSSAHSMNAPMEI